MSNDINKEYELLYFVNVSHEPEEVTSIKNKVTEIINKYNGTIIKEEDQGKRKLAYNIKQIRHAFYTLINFSVSPEESNKIDNEILLMPEIIRHKIVVKEKTKVVVYEDVNEDKTEDKKETEEEKTKPEIKKEEKDTAKEPKEDKEDIEEKKEDTTKAKEKTEEEKKPKKEEIKVDIAELDKKIDELLSDHNI